MSNKFPLVSVTALLLLAAIIGAGLVTRKPRLPQYSYPARITLYLEDKGEIISLNYDELIAGCVFGMMEPKSEKEALKSAACAANTAALYLLHTKNGFANSGAHFSDKQLPYISPDSLSEKYGAKYSAYLEKVNEAVRYGMEHVITYEGEPICAACCPISTGKTDNSTEIMENGKPYLTAVSVPFDKEADGYESTTALTDRIVCGALKELAPEAVLSGHPEEWFSDAKYSDSGTVISINYGGVTLGGAEIRKALELKSAAFTVEYFDDRFHFSCRGIGENVGMSLYGANILARQGKSMEEILSYFYPKCDIVTQ